MHYDAAVGSDFGGIGSLVLTLRLESSIDIVERELRARAFNDDRIMRLSSAFLNLPTEDFEKGLDIAVGEIASLETVTRVSVWRTDGDRMVRRSCWESSIKAPTFPLPERVRRDDFATLKRAAEGKDTLLMEPWRYGPEFETEREAYRISGVTSCLVSPMMAGEEFVGTVMIETTLQEEFGAVDIGAVHSACAILAEAFLRNDAERLLARQARVDRVTGLSNRWAFDVDLECALEELRSDGMDGLALAVIDLDRFKAVNDTFGHAIGDHLLAEVAHRLRHQADDRTTLARLGGDEILVLVQHVDGPDEAYEVLEHLLEVFRVPFNLPSGALALTASAGLAHTADGDTEMGELMARADVAMYQVKATGGDAVTIADRDSHIERSQRLRREADLQRAIQAGTLWVHYQPEVELATGRLLGAEALIRWQHPHSGLMTAAEFIPLIESTALIETVGRQVLREACKAASRWRGRVVGDDFLIRVNVAARQLRQERFVQEVGDALADADLPPSALCLELTESTLLTDPTVAVERFGQLRSLGVGLAIDDFGIGYSSFLQLRSLPLSALKIDRSFVTDLPAKSHRSGDRVDHARPGRRARPHGHRRGCRDRRTTCRVGRTGLSRRARVSARSSHAGQGFRRAGLLGRPVFSARSRGQHGDGVTDPGGARRGDRAVDAEVRTVLRGDRL